MKAFIEASEQFYIEKIYYLLKRKSKTQSFSLILFFLRHILLFISALSQNESDRADQSTYLYSILVAEGDFVNACKVAAVTLNITIILFLLACFLRYYLFYKKIQGKESQKTHKHLEIKHETTQDCIKKLIKKTFRIILESYEPVLVIILVHFSLNYNFLKELGIFNVILTILIGIIIVDCDYDYTTEKQQNCIARPYHHSQLFSLLALAGCVILQSLWKAESFLILFLYYLIEMSIYMQFRKYTCLKMHIINIFTLITCGTVAIICESYSPLHETNRFSTVLILSLLPVIGVMSLKISSVQEDLKIKDFLIYNERSYLDFNDSISWQSVDYIMRTNLLEISHKSELERRQILMLSLSIQSVLSSDDEFNNIQKDNEKISNDGYAFLKSDEHLHDMLKDNLMACYSREIQKVKQMKGKKNNRVQDIGWFFSYFVFLIEKRNNLILYIMEADTLKTSSYLSYKDRQILHTIDQFFLREKKILDKIQNVMNPFSNSFINAIIFEESLLSIENHLELSVTKKIEFLDLLDERTIQSNQLMQLANELEEENKLARKLLNHMGSIDPDNPELMKLQDIYIELLAFSARDVKFVNRSHQQLLRRNKNNIFKQNTLPTGCIVFAVFSKEGDWVIKKVSNSFYTVFGMHGKDVKNQSITNLMPTLFRQQHDKYIKDFLALDCAEISLARHKDRVLYAKDSKGYLVPVSLDVRINEFEDKTGHYIGIAAELSICDREIMIILYSRSNLIVNGYSEELANILFSSGKETKLNKLFPFVNQLNNEEKINNNEKQQQEILKNQLHASNGGSTYFGGKKYPIINGVFPLNYRMEYLLVRRKIKNISYRDNEDNEYETSKYQFLLSIIEIKAPEHRYHKDVGVVKIYALDKLKPHSDAHYIKSLIADNQQYYEDLLGIPQISKMLYELESQENYTSSHNLRNNSLSNGIKHNTSSASGLSASENSELELYSKGLKSQKHTAANSRAEYYSKNRETTAILTLSNQQLNKNQTHNSSSSSHGNVKSYDPSMNMKQQAKFDLGTVKLIDSQQNIEENNKILPQQQQSSVIFPVGIDSFKQSVTSDCQIASTGDNIGEKSSHNFDHTKHDKQSTQILESPNGQSHEKAKSLYCNSKRNYSDREAIQESTNRAMIQNQLDPIGLSPRFQSSGVIGTFGNDIDEERALYLNSVRNNQNINSARESIQNNIKEDYPEKIALNSTTGIVISPSTNNIVDAPSQQKFFQSSNNKLQRHLDEISRTEECIDQSNQQQNSINNHIPQDFNKSPDHQDSKINIAKPAHLHAKQLCSDQHNHTSKQQYTRMQDNMSTSSQESTQTSAKKSLYKLVKNNKSNQAINLINLFGIASFLVIFCLGVIQYFITTVAIEDNMLEWNEYDFPAVYQANLFTMMKDMNTLSLLNRTDKVYYFDITKAHQTELVNEASAHSWVIKSQNTEMITHMSHVGTQRRVFQLILAKPANYTIGQNYNMSILNQTSSVPTVLLGILYPTSLLYAITFSQYHTFRYAAQLANGRPEYFTIVNQLRLSGYLSEIYESIQEEKINEKDSISFQLNFTMSMVIIVSSMCVGIIAPLYAYVQILRDQILNLFGTFTSQQLDSVKSKLYRYLQSSNKLSTFNTKISRGSALRHSSNIKESFLMKKQLATRQVRHTLSFVTKLPKYNLSLLLCILIIFGVVITSPIINQIITQNYFTQVVDDYQVSYQIQQVRNQILKLIGLDYYCMTLKLYPKSKPMTLSQFIDNATEVKNSNQNTTTVLKNLIQSQSKVSRYKQSEYDDFFFPVLIDGIYEKLIEFPQYQRNQTSPIPMQQCQYINQKYLSQGLQLGFQKYFGIFDQIYYLLNTTDATASNAILANLQKSIELYELTLSGKCLSDAAYSLSTFLKDIHQHYYDVIMIEQVALLVVQLVLVTLILIIGGMKLSAHLAKQICQTQGYLQVLNINMLLDNTYVVSYVRSHHAS